MHGRTIPDLRADNEVTTEHCYVLINKLAGLLSEYGDDVGELAKNIDPEKFKEDMAGIVSTKRFFKLYNTDSGKLLLLGMFYQKYVLDQGVSTEDLES